LIKAISDVGFANMGRYKNMLNHHRLTLTKADIHRIQTNLSPYRKQIINLKGAIHEDLQNEFEEDSYETED
jgi:hypothetical protein